MHLFSLLGELSYNFALPGWRTVLAQQPLLNTVALNNVNTSMPLVRGAFIFKVNIYCLDFYGYPSTSVHTSLYHDG